MRSTGIVRQVDGLGRIVIPKEIRKVMNINQMDGLEIFTDDDGHIILRKYTPGCIFCGEGKEVTAFKGKNICKSCRELLLND